MSDFFRGRRPDITPAQVAAVLIAGVPAIATLLATLRRRRRWTAPSRTRSPARVTWCSRARRPC